MYNNTKNMIKQIGKNIRRERKRQNLTQEMLAERSSEVMNANSVSAIERGQGNPKLTTLAEIAAGLGISLSEMVKLPHQEAIKTRVDVNTVNYLISLLEELKK